MVLPGVPRTKRIQFVKTLVSLLFSQGLEEITEAELADLSALVKEMLGSVEPVITKVEPEDVEEEPGGC